MERPISDASRANTREYNWAMLQGNASTALWQCQRKFSETGHCPCYNFRKGHRSGPTPHEDSDLPLLKLQTLSRMVQPAAIWQVFTVALAVAALTAACSLLPEGEPTVLTSAIVEEAESLQPGEVPVLALSPVGDIWTILSTRHVDRTDIDADDLVQGAVDYLITRLRHAGPARRNHTRRGTGAAREPPGGVRAAVGRVDCHLPATSNGAPNHPIPSGSRRPPCAASWPRLTTRTPPTCRHSDTSWRTWSSSEATRAWVRR